MAKINPKNLSWTAPTENTDGSPIENALSYRLVVNGTDFADFPGSLNADGRFEQPIAMLGLPEGRHTLHLKAFYVEDPDSISDPSNGVEIFLGVLKPNPPTAFSAE